jgi:CheY-like chemotaxis protein/anti-sigma regulatory factor (Ser/Thr protein kinase)
VGAVLGNETRLAQIFLNLIVNAAQAFESEDKEHNRIRIVAHETGDDCFIEVQDNGPGIPPENMRRIFDPFFTTKPVGVGTGLGLSICHGLIESMHGSISVTSELGKGSTFTVQLRSSRDRPAAVSNRFPTLSPHVRARVLIVDDEPLILRSVARLLKDEHDVEIAANGREALTKLAEDGPFDLILCDLMMPEMNGMDLHHAIARSDPDVARRFVFLTGGAYTDSARAFLAQVNNPKLDKPIQPNLLRSVVHTVLRG